MWLALRTEVVLPDSRVVRDPKEIRRRYLRGVFIIDLVGGWLASFITFREGEAPFLG
jgi:hypothetical protein